MIHRRDLILRAAGASLTLAAAPASVRPYKVAGQFQPIVDCTFGIARGGATIHTMDDLARKFHFKYIYDNGRLDRMPYEWSKHTAYALGDPRSLHEFHSDALILKGRLPPNGGFHPGGIEAGLLRLKTPMAPGMYIEMRAKLPRGIGLLPAFWLIPGAQYSDTEIVLAPWPPEIDIFEFLQLASRPRPTVMEANIEVKGHPEQFGWPNDMFSKFQSGRYEPGIDFSTDYHVFALDWLKDKPVWLVDGVPVKQTYYKWGDAPATLMVSNQIGLSLPGVDVSAMEHEDRDWDFGIKHIRVWRRTGNLGD
jgi:hypothetical protein